MWNIDIRELEHSRCKLSENFFWVWLFGQKKQLAYCDWFIQNVLNHLKSTEQFVTFDKQFFWSPLFTGKDEGSVCIEWLKLNEVWHHTGSGTHYELLVVNIVCSSQVPTILKSRIAPFINTSFTAGGKTSMLSIPVVCSQDANYPGEGQKSHQFSQSVNFRRLSFCLSDEFWNLSLNPTFFFFFF